MKFLAEYLYDMNFEDFPEAKPVFDEPAVKAVLAETGLPLAPGRTIQEIWESLEDISRGNTTGTSSIRLIRVEKATSSDSMPSPTLRLHPRGPETV